MTMRTGLLCLLLCLAHGACTSRATRCDGSLQPINVPAADPRPVPDASAKHDPGSP